MTNLESYSFSRTDECWSTNGVYCLGIFCKLFLTLSTSKIFACLLLKSSTESSFTITALFKSF